MSSLDQRRHKSVVVGPTTTNVARGRVSRQAHLAQESQWLWSVGWEEPDDRGTTAGGRCDATSEALLLPGYQPPPALFTPAVRTKPHKTGDLAAARREKKEMGLFVARCWPARSSGRWRLTMIMGKWSLERPIPCDHRGGGKGGGLRWGAWQETLAGLLRGPQHRRAGPRAAMARGAERELDALGVHDGIRHVREPVRAHARDEPQRLGGDLALLRRGHRLYLRHQVLAGLVGGVHQGAVEVVLLPVDEEVAVGLR